MWLLWFMFALSRAIVVVVAWNFWRRAHGLPVKDFSHKSIPWWVDVLFLFTGLVGVVSTVPGVFFGQPHWALDHLLRLLGKASNAA